MVTKGRRSWSIDRRGQKFVDSRSRSSDLLPHNECEFEFSSHDLFVEIRDRVVRTFGPEDQRIPVSSPDVVPITLSPHDVHQCNSTGLSKAEWYKMYYINYMYHTGSWREIFRRGSSPAWRDSVKTKFSLRRNSAGDSVLLFVCFTLRGVRIIASRLDQTNDLDLKF
jgi:hypothetical protein